MEKVGIVLVNYKDYAKNFLDECRDSIRTQTFPKEQTNIYIVDNASSEETKKYLHQTYPEAVIIPREDGNYAAANNSGIKKAREDGCEYFVIVNMDVKLDNHWLEELVKAIKLDKEIGFVQSMLLLYPKKEEEWNSPKINSVGNVSHYLGFGFTRGYDEPASNYPEQDLQEIQGYSSGCSFITTKEVLDKIGDYDEEYYMYHDDLEMSWRLKLAGYKIMLAPSQLFIINMNLPEALGCFIIWKETVFWLYIAIINGRRCFSFCQPCFLWSLECGLMPLSMVGYPRNLR